MTVKDSHFAIVLAIVGVVAIICATFIGLGMMFDKTLPEPLSITLTSCLAALFALLVNPRSTSE